MKRFQFKSVATLKIEKPLCSTCDPCCTSQEVIQHGTGLPPAVESHGQIIQQPQLGRVPPLHLHGLLEPPVVPRIQELKSQLLREHSSQLPFAFIRNLVQVRIAPRSR